MYIFSCIWHFSHQHVLCLVTLRLHNCIQLLSKAVFFHKSLSGQRSKIFVARDYKELNVVNFVHLES